MTNSSLVAEIAFKQNSTLRMTTTKQYDLLNRLTNISSTTASFTNSFAYLYNDANQRTKVTREDGSYWNYGYDDLGQVTTGKRHWADNSPVAGQQYEYDSDDIGNRKSTTSNSKPETRNSLYTANLLNQYTARTVPGYADVIGSANTNATVTVNYQRATRKDEYWHKELGLSNTVSAVYAGVTNIAVLNDGSNPDIVTTNKGNLFLPQTPEQFTYDDDGNLAGDGRWTYTWDGENRLIQMETKTGAVSAGTPKQKLEFAYDDQWRRIQKKVSEWNGSSYAAAYTNRFAYDGWNLVAVLNPITLCHSFVWGIDLKGTEQGLGGIGGLILVANSDNERGFVSFDGNGNVVGLASVYDGISYLRCEYDPFGRLLSRESENSRKCPFGFSTKYQDSESSMLYYGYRYFICDIGRWISRDPINEKGGANLMGFVGNDGVNRLDVLGMSGCSACSTCCCADSVNISGLKVLYTGSFPNSFPLFGNTKGFYGFEFTATFGMTFQKKPAGSPSGGCSLQWTESNSANSTVNAAAIPPGVTHTYTGGYWDSSMYNNWRQVNSSCPTGKVTASVVDTPGIVILNPTSTGLLDLLIDITLNSTQGCGCSVSSATATVHLVVDLGPGATPGPSSGFWILN